MENNIDHLTAEATDDRILVGPAANTHAHVDKSPDNAKALLLGQQKVAVAIPADPNEAASPEEANHASAAVPIAELPLPSTSEASKCMTANGVPSQSEEGKEAQASPSTQPLPTPKPRAIKTKEQKEALEAAYQLKQYPEEDVRRALGERIGLTEQQVQVWFSHKRRKEKKDQEEAAARVVIEQRQAEQRETQEPPGNAAELNGSAEQAQLDGYQDATAQNPAEPIAEKSSVVADAAPAPEPMEIVPAGPPPDAAPTAEPPAKTRPSPAEAGKEAAQGAVQRKKDSDEQAGPGGPAVALGDPHVKDPPIARLVKLLKEQPQQGDLTIEERLQLPELVDAVKQSMTVPFRVDGPPLIYEFDDLPTINEEGVYLDEMPTQKRKRVEGDDDEGNRKKRQSAGAKGSARNNKELRLKRLADMKEAEKMEREKRRNEEKAERENKKKELARTKEEIRLRALQEREERKLQAQAEKERKAQERKEALVERRKEKEMLKALQAQEKQATRLRQRDAGTGPKDDLDLEWETLLAQQQADGYASGTEDGEPRDHPPPVRPEFPPPHLDFKPWLPAELEGSLGNNLLFVWNFLRSFRSLLCTPYITVPQLLQAVQRGERSRLLGELHISMIRIVQADMEEAHATGAMQSGSAINFLDRAIVSCATMLEEAWAWGFDVDAWRGHVGPLTWPEVLRQQAIVWGLGPKRPKPKKEVKPKMGTDGEDVYTDESGALKLKLPPRFGVGTVKAAAWAVLAETGPEGLSIGEIARRIQQSGLRDLRTSKTPEASVAGALSRDVIFARTAPATYALQAIVTHCSQLDGESYAPLKKEVAQKTEGKEATPDAKQQMAGEQNGKKSEERSNEEDEENEGESSGDEEEEDEQTQSKTAGEPWVQTLLSKDYKDIDVTERAAILAALTHLALDGPTIRNTLEARHEEAGRVRKQMWEEARAEKKRKQEEAAVKAKQAAEEAQKVLEALKVREASMAPSEAPAGAVPESAKSTPAPDDGNAEEQRASTTPKLEPEGDAEASPSRPGEQNRSEADTRDMSAAPQPSSTLDTDGQAKPEPLEPSNSEAPKPTDAAAADKKDEADEEKTAAAAAKERQLQRAETIRKAEEANATRGEPLGLDRRYNKFWRFANAEDCSRDPLADTLVMESHLDGSLRYLGHEEGVNALIQVLDKRGAREGPLYNNLLRYREELGKPGSPFRFVSGLGSKGSQSYRYFQIVQYVLETYTLPGIPEADNKEEEDNLYEDQLAWIQDVPLVAARKVKGKHPNPQDEDPCIARMRRDFLLVERALPRAALGAEWDQISWKEAVRACSSPADFRDSLAKLELAVQDGFLSPYYPRYPLLVRGAWLPTGQDVASALLGTNNEVQRLADPPPEASPDGLPQEDSHLSWLPQTLAAVSLRLHSLDANLFYQEDGPAERHVLLAYNYIQRPAAPAPPPASDSETAPQRGSCTLTSVSGQPVTAGGRALPILLPPFPMALAASQRQPFTLEWSRVKKEIADERAGILPPPVVPKLPIAQPAEKPAKKQRRSSTKGKAGGKGKSGQGKGRSKQSALREEFDRQSEEEEAAERAAFSTPGFSDDDSDDFQPRGRKSRIEIDEEISD